MIRTDGMFVFYKIQHQQPSDKKWVYSIYGTPEITPNGSGIRDTFTASGFCWQQTGEHGVYELKNAKKGLKLAYKMLEEDGKAKKTNIKKLRLVQVSIMQKTIPI